MAKECKEDSAGQMPVNYADHFIVEAKFSGLDCVIKNYTPVRGWPETVILNDKKCFVKSVECDGSQQRYYQTVDLRISQEKGDFVFLCCGMKGELREIFIIPWNRFFMALKQGRAVNVYKFPRERWQYRFLLRANRREKVLAIPNGPEVDVSPYYFSVGEAIKQFKQVH